MKMDVVIVVIFYDRGEINIFFFVEINVHKIVFYVIIISEDYESKIRGFIRNY